MECSWELHISSTQNSVQEQFAKETLATLPLGVTRQRRSWNRDLHDPFKGGPAPGRASARRARRASARCTPSLRPPRRAWR